LLQLQKVTRFFALIALGVMIVALGFAAKHGQFESRAQHGHFLSKSVKMENVCRDQDAALHCTEPPVDALPQLEVVFFIAPPPPSGSCLVPPRNFSLPLLV
jgi:hypothetical protein